MVREDKVSFTCSVIASVDRRPLSMAIVIMLIILPQRKISLLFICNNTSYNLYVALTFGVMQMYIAVTGLSLPRETYFSPTNSGTRIPL